MFFTIKFKLLLGIVFLWLCYGPVTSFAQLNGDTPTPIGRFLGGALPSQNPNSPAGSWGVVPAFPNAPVQSALAIEAKPDDGDLWVGSIRGKIQAFTPNPNTSQVRTIVDISDRTTTEGGLIGIAFHPDFGVANSPNRHYFFVYYASHCALNNPLTQVDLSRCVTFPPPKQHIGFYGGYLRLSRFEYTPGATPQQVKNSETPMINIRLFNTSHRGGGPVIGNDGYLYMAIGEQQLEYTAQDIRTNLHGGLRLAVDITENANGGWSCPVGSHLPRRTFQDDYNTTTNPNRPGHDDELSGRLYCIPNDNPWQDPTSNQNFEEYFSIGHRNPHRVTVDRLTGRLWSGEVGSNRSEEVNIIEKGKNYGWPCREGFKSKPGFINEPYCQANQSGPLTDPVIDFDRTEANALIGGYVYRGVKFPELYGKYLTGDWVLGHIYAVSYDEGTGAATKMRLTTWENRALGTWGQDLNGEIYLGHVGATTPLHTLDKIVDSTPEPPATLFATGAFNNLTSLNPASYWLPYGPNQPFWSDGAIKRRWIAIPDGEKIGFSADDNWDFPVGTVIMKHFELPLDETNNSVTTRLETRFMVHGEDEWYGITYRWNNAQSDAVLLTEGESADYTISTTGGGTRVQTWDFPSRTQCLFCHNSSVEGVAGVRTHTINGDYTYPKSGIVRNQLLTWNQLGWFTPALNAGDIAGYLKSVHIDDTQASIAERARSWLDINCSNCHRPGGPGDRAPFDTRLTTSLNAQNLINGSVVESLGLPQESLITPKCVSCSVIYQRVAALNNIAMPPLAKHLVDTQGLTTLRRWINSLDKTGPAIGESGIVSIRQPSPVSWHKVNLINSYTKPVVVLGPISNQGVQPAIARVRNVVANSFEFQIDEWTNQDGSHASETLSYLVVESGSFTLANGQQIIAGVKPNVDNSWKIVKFGQSFTQLPVVLTQVSSVNNPDPVVSRANLVTQSGFDVRLQEEEARRPNARNGENIHWIAIEPGATAAGIEAVIALKGINHNWERINFSQDHVGATPFIAKMQTTMGADTAALRYRRLNKYGVDLLVQEEKTRDNEVTHRKETIGYVIFTQPGSIQ